MITHEQNKIAVLHSIMEIAPEIIILMGMDKVNALLGDKPDALIYSAKEVIPATKATILKAHYDQQIHNLSEYNAIRGDSGNHNSIYDKASNQYENSQATDYASNSDEY